MQSAITIVGAGIGGLSTALALQQRGLPVVILEQAGELRELGAGVQLSPNGVAALASLGLLDQLLAIAVEPQAKEIRLWNTGETWPLFDLGGVSRARYGFPYLMVHRGDLQTLLATAVRAADPDAIRTGAKVTEVREAERSVMLVLQTGEHFVADAVIGADGIHSTVRSHVLGPATARFTGCMAWRGLVPAERLPAHLSRPVGVNWVGPGRHVVTYPLRRGELINFVGVVERADWETESWTARGTREECAKDFEGWHADVHALIDNIDEHFRWALVSRDPIGKWSKGKVVLLGDACHPMLPFMAQGAVMAIEDGVMLARCLAASPSNTEQAYAQYEVARIERANRCVLAADRNRHLFHNDRLQESAEAAAYVETQWSEDKVNDRYDWLFSYDVSGVPLQIAA